MATTNAARAVEGAATEPSIILSQVNKWYGEFHVLRNINLTVSQRGRIVICGPSGSGKSTLIRCINRLEEHQSGRIVVEGTELTNNLRQIDAIRANVGMVFQSFDLSPSHHHGQPVHRARLGEEDAAGGSREGGDEVS